MAQLETWRAWNTNTLQTDTYTLTRSDSGIVTEYSWSGAGDPVSAAELTDHRKVDQRFVDGSRSTGWIEWENWADGFSNWVITQQDGNERTEGGHAVFPVENGVNHTTFVAYRDLPSSDVEIRSRFFSITTQSHRVASIDLNLCLQG